MSVKMLSLCLMSFASLSLAGCSAKCEPQTEYVKVPYEVKVPVKCEAPKVECDFSKSSDTEVIRAMLECIVDLKRSNEVCKQVKME